MTNEELVDVIWERLPKLKRNQVVAVVQSLGDVVLDELKAGREVRIAGVAKFHVITQPARPARNVRMPSGAQRTLPPQAARGIVKVKVSKTLKDAVKEVVK